MKMEKFDIAFNQINGTVFYREKIDYFFRADLSNGSESDPISFPNVPYVVSNIIILSCHPYTFK